jgi:hypothetical protein
MVGSILVGTVAKVEFTSGFRASHVDTGGGMLVEIHEELGAAGVIVLAHGAAGGGVPSARSPVMPKEER